MKQARLYRPPAAYISDYHRSNCKKDSRHIAKSDDTAPLKKGVRVAPRPMAIVRLPLPPKKKISVQIPRSAIARKKKYVCSRSTAGAEPKILERARELAGSTLGDDARWARSGGSLVDWRRRGPRLPRPRSKSARAPRVFA